MIRPLFFLLLCLLPAIAQADELRPAYLEMTQESGTGWRLVWKLPRKSGISPDASPIFPEGCSVSGAPFRELTDTALITHYRLTCSPDIGGQDIGLSGLENTNSDILVRISFRNRPVQVARLTADQPATEIRARASFMQVIKSYFLIGVEHILSGYDHLLFVIALVLLLGRLWSVAKAVTAFTVAHSLTLIGTSLGLFGLPQAPVEACIALSIIFLAVEIAKQDPDHSRLSEKWPWAVAFLFGLLHGFGFAGALKEIGLPEGDVPAALLAFNLGVEAGQLAIVLLTLTMIQILARAARRSVRPATKFASYAIGIMASFWLMERILI